MNSGFFVLIILVLFLLWLILVRPQRRRHQAQQAMIDHLRIGDEVLTAGGFFATGSTRTRSSSSSAPAPRPASPSVRSRW